MVSHALAQVVGRAFAWDEVLTPYIYVFYVAFVVAFIFTPAMRMVAMHFGIIDAPDRLRKMHSTPVAYLGGVAVFLGWISALALGQQFVRLHVSDPLDPSPLVIKFSIVAGACIVVLLGLWDDIQGVRPFTKIVAQAMAAVFLLVDDIGIRCTAPVLEPVGALLHARLGLPLPPEWLIVVSSSILVITVVVGCCNASNLIDGLDGLCGGVTAIIVAGFLFVAVNLAMNGGGLNANWDGQRVVLALALLGAVLGFVPYNFNPASIFMGDTGSMFLGYCCAVMIILMGQGQHPKWFLASMVMFAFPVLDTALAFARRWVNKRPLFGADRYHFHHQLLARGFTVKQAVMISYGLAIFFAMMGASIVLVRTRFAGVFWLVIFSWIIVAAVKMGMIHERPLVVNRRDLSNIEGLPEPTLPEVEPANVLEVREDGEGRKDVAWIEPGNQIASPAKGEETVVTVQPPSRRG